MHRPRSADGVDEAYQWCERLATSHYENFPVGSLLLPRSMRLHVYAVYAFSRMADDVADEPWTTNTEHRIAKLIELETLVKCWAAGDTSDGSLLGTAVANTIRVCDLDIQLFLDLLSAFRQDAQFKQPLSWDDLYDYCRRSANPVGRLVLAIAHVDSEQALRASDHVCTGLQLINFWQDLSVDRHRDRNYLPRVECERNGEIATLYDGIRIARERLSLGAGIVEHVHGRLRWELKFIIATASRILRACEQNAEGLFVHRPALRRTDYIGALMAILTGRWSNELR